MLHILNADPGLSIIVNHKVNGLKYVSFKFCGKYNYNNKRIIPFPGRTWAIPFLAKSPVYIITLYICYWLL